MFHVKQNKRGETMTTYAPLKTGKVVLCATKLKGDDKDQIYFKSSSAQQSYFSSCARHTYTNCSVTYGERQGITINDNIDTVRDCNYLYFSNFSGKTIYCKITGLEYRSPNSTTIYYEEDSFQTYLFDITINQCFVEREMITNDTIGENIEPENVDLGEMITQNVIHETMTDLVILFEIASKTNFGEVSGAIVDKVYRTGSFRTADSVSSANAMINSIQADEKTELIGITMFPKAFIGDNVTSTALNRTLPKNTSSIQGYTPKNKKLFTYPYNYLEINNNNGQSKVLRWEFFNDSATLQIRSSICSNPSVICFPTNYKGNTVDLDNSIFISDFPTCQWSVDQLQQWINQNKNTMAINLISSTLGGLLMTGGNPIGGLVGASTSIASSVGQTLDKPPLVKGVSNSNINVAMNMQKFSYMTKTITAQKAEIIDQYFSMYGYATNRVKIPNTTSRLNWNYVKTRGSNVTGSKVPTPSLKRINDMFDNGVTFWHNTGTMYNYSNDNSV